jgi:hypothetical protein
LQGVETLTFEYGRVFLHGPTLPSRADIPRAIRDIRLETGF